MTRQSAPTSPAVVLTVAGSDSGGGAGIQADVKTIEASGGFATTAITGVTAQNTTGVESTHLVPESEIEAQIDAVCSDFDVAAVKTGMLATSDVVTLVAERASDLPNLVVDPVMVAASGDRLLEPEAETAYEELIAEATLVTPNADEAAVLTDIDVEDEADARRAGEQLLDLGADAALVKGGHVPGDEVVDVLVTADAVETFRHDRVSTEATHGSGCTLSAAIATELAHGVGLTEAVGTGIGLLSRAVRYNLDVGQGPGAVHHLVEARERAARQPTAEEVEFVVEGLVEANARELVPEVGMNVVGATPYAEVPGETAAVEGRITRTLSGIKPNRGVRFGASSHVARFLLAAREFEPDLRFAINCRFDERVEAALESLAAPVAEFDRDAEPESVKEQEGSTMQWGARRAFEESEGSPVAVIDRGEVGKEAIVKLLAPDAETLLERATTLADEL
ncbi:bifunctional hydroxymethylpyrimidine kinase/phosphomethylpyrimidine kinase [Haloarculaceae archaeon H-GB2-1]|nr:bifunctional hydroxymethylpyrimidine kinase/phosphomethylpyrimidine kinase [Haloarculaceae archaeon H-GB1-1]MEA5388889.1 bifunctional hydroxymethylpyrimidine kinase/phosphomethylpyrimidine kinase [Haloarculaceae archaeon H-GB11]MEA5406942.1 bifunctional hydroxymethylpyrimidine kinase/phosphomethylpyrimidine kinase [Haloarculaceae archaeon H-GB2-1]